MSLSRSPQMIRLAYYFGRYNSGRAPNDPFVPPELHRLGIRNRYAAFELFRKTIGEGRSEKVFRNSLQGDVAAIQKRLIQGRRLQPSRVAALRPLLDASPQRLWTEIRTYIDKSKIPIDGAKSRSNGKIAKATQSLKISLNAVKAEKAIAKSATIQLERSQGFQSDSKIRKAIEGYSMGKAVSHYESQGFNVVDRHSNEPYDLYCTFGNRILYVEVKGTQGTGEQVFLTRGEVKHCRAHVGRCELFILHSIQLSEKSGMPAGGKSRIHENWNIDLGELECISYVHRPK